MYDNFFFLLLGRELFISKVSLILQFLFIYMYSRYSVLEGKSVVVFILITMCIIYNILLSRLLFNKNFCVNFINNTNGMFIIWCVIFLWAVIGLIQPLLFINMMFLSDFEMIYSLINLFT